MSKRPTDPRPDKMDGPELFVALVYPAGTDSEMIEEHVSQAFRDVGYQPVPIHLIERLVAKKERNDEHKRYMALMDAGNECARAMKRRDALAIFAANEIRKERRQLHKENSKAGKISGRTAEILPRHVFIIRSLKRQEEVRALRAIYGDALLVLASNSSPESRRDRLTWRITRSSGSGGPPEQYQWMAEQIIARDHRELDDDYGQRVSDTFPLADAYVDASHPESFKQSFGRIVQLLFGHQFRTPTRAEYGMFHAYGAALRSSDLSRQVGAAITDPDGEVIALGTNEVPKAGGGLYGEDAQTEDRRDFTQGSDVSTEIKKTALVQMLSVLSMRGFLSSGALERVDEAWKLLQGTDLLNVLEFGRSVHAEMAAIVHAARRGSSVRNCTLYTTTFPCHVCARHIIASGIARVVYNEPYPKSLARYLHLDAMAVDTEPGPDRIPFDPYVGVSSALYVALFKALTRKTPDGKIPMWTPVGAKPRRFGLPREYLVQESRAAGAWAGFRRSPQWSQFLKKTG
jgi:deoxycytidylate deaminase